jgi:hypothetical protein
MANDDSPTIRHGNVPPGSDGQAAQPGHEDDGLGAVEGESPTDPQRGNPQGPGVDSQGQPNDPVRTGQDRIGANLDETEG